MVNKKNIKATNVRTTNRANKVIIVNERRNKSTAKTTDKPTAATVINKFKSTVTKNTTIDSIAINEVRNIAKDLIKEFEGLRLVPYKCYGGMVTIGYGHVISSNEKISSSITKAQSLALLNLDIKIAEYALNRYCKVPLSTLQRASLISFIFNLGAGSFQSSTLRQKLNRGEYVAASNEFSKWVYAGGIKLQGLVRRRNLERKLFLGDIDIDIADGEYPQNYDHMNKYVGRKTMQNVEAMQTM